MALNLMLNDSRNHIKLKSRLAVKSQTRLAWLFGCCHAQGLSLGLLFCPSELLDSNIQHLLEGGKDWVCWVLVLRKRQCIFVFWSLCWGWSHPKSLVYLVWSGDYDFAYLTRPR